MATNLSAPVTEDIWHLSIDDLLSPLPEKPRLGGPGPFVINLSSSTAGIGLPSLNLAGCESAHAYEIQRNEDGRIRYRLRLGPFDTEQEADLILDMVREIYPSALTATAGPDDLKAITTIRAKAAAVAEARRPPAPPKQPQPPLVLSRVDPIDAALKAVASRPSAPVAPKPQTPPATVVPATVIAAPATAAPAAVDAMVLSVDLSIAEILPPKRPAVPAVTLRAESPVIVQSAAPKFIEPPLVTERVDFAPAKKVSPPASTTMPAPPVVTQRAVATVTQSMMLPAASVPAAPAPAPSPTATVAPAVVVPAQAPKAVATAPVVAAVAPKINAAAPPPARVAPPAPATPASVPIAPAYVAPAAPSLPKQPASIWEPLPVAARSVPSKFAAPATRPAMSVSAPLARRAAAPAAAAAIAAKASPAPKQPSPQPASVATAAKTPVLPTTTTAVRKPQPATRPAAPAEKHLDFDSTQTMRALTPKELSDENALAWFVIELATSTEAFDPDTVPNLDIFAEYRLYSVAEVGTARIVHSLRVGFFSAEIAAKAVASYLAEYYDKPAIKRVSFAERERFAEQVLEARKDVGATGRHAVIEITDDLVARRKRFIANAQSTSPAT